MTSELHPHYPASKEIDEWCVSLLERSASRELRAEIVPDPVWIRDHVVSSAGPCHYVRFETPERAFYGVWQPAPSSPAPVAIHVPGYGAEMTAHPGIAEAGFNVLEINPLGYMTPDGPTEPDYNWQVMPDTVRTRGRAGYVDWLSDACVAVRWARGQACAYQDRVGFFGTSQGGGTALLLASMHRDTGARCVAADLPYLTGYPLMIDQPNHGAYAAAFTAFSQAGGAPDEWRALGFIDTISHAHRLDMPTLLTAGSDDDVTPPHTIEALFGALPGTRSYTLLRGQGHAYTREFIHLTAAWFRLYL